MYIILYALIATISLVVIVALYERHLRSKASLTHAYTFSYDDQLVYVTSQTKLSDSDITYHKRMVARNILGNESLYDSIGVIYLGKKMIDVNIQT